jgi:hypothetical protein
MQTARKRCEEPRRRWDWTRTSPADHGVGLGKRGDDVLEALVGATEAALVLGQEKRHVERRELVADRLGLLAQGVDHRRDEAHVGKSLDHPLGGFLVDPTTGHLGDPVTHERFAALMGELAVALLAGLGGNALFGLWWLDPAAALAIAALAVNEGIEAWRGEGCCVVEETACVDECCVE